MRIDQIKIDEWYDIPGYGGKYQISNLLFMATMSLLKQYLQLQKNYVPFSRMKQKQRRCTQKKEESEVNRTKAIRILSVHMNLSEKYTVSRCTDQKELRKYRRK